MKRSHESNLTASGNAVLNINSLSQGENSRASTVVHPRSASNNKADLETLREDISKILVCLINRKSELHEGSMAVDLAERAKQELCKPEPDKVTARSFMATLAEETKSIADISSAAIALGKAIGLIL